jgi:curved DNA-binding protein CbpA
MQKIHTHYDTLSIVRDAPPEVIRAAYKVLSQNYHPDRNSDNPNATAIMAKINDAYAVLSDPEKRKKYDRWVAEQEASTTQQDEPAKKTEPEKKNTQTKPPSPVKSKNSFIKFIGFLFALLFIFAGASAYDDFTKEQKQKQAKTFEKEKSLGTFDIVDMTKNGRYIFGVFGGIGYSDNSDVYDSNHHRLVGRVTISESEMIVHIDWNGDNNLAEQEKEIFEINSISKLTNPDDYNRGIIETNIDERVNFIINPLDYYRSYDYELIYMKGNDQYILLLR